MSVSLPAGCTRARLERRISVIGVDLRIDDDLSSLTGVMEEAWVEVLGYCQMLYSTTALGSSEWVLLRWADIALESLCERRGNLASQSVQARYERALESLAMIRDGAMQIPGVALEKSTAPVLSNQRVRTWPFPHVVTERSQSTGDPEGYRRNDDPADIDPIP